MPLFTAPSSLGWRAVARWGRRALLVAWLLSVLPVLVIAMSETPGVQPTGSRKTAQLIAIVLMNVYIFGIIPIAIYRWLGRKGKRRP